MSGIKTMKTNPKITIITVTYNAQEHLESTIKSIIEQDYPDVEFIIIDGGSTDGTLDIIKKYEKSIDFWVSEPDKGIYDAMNKGIEKANGEYLCFLGAGDTLRKKILKNIEPNLKFKSELLYGKVFKEKKGYDSTGEHDKYQICFGNICHQAILYHRSVFDIIGKYSLEYPLCADYEFNIRCYADERIEKNYIDLTISNFMEGGVSDNNIDMKFKEDREKLILKYLGEKYFDLFKLYESYNLPNTPYSTNDKFWIKEDLITLVNSNSQKQIAIFGVGGFGKKIFKFIEENNKRFQKNISVKYFFDNDEKKWGTSVCDVKIVEPKSTNFDQVEKIIIASFPGRYEIKKQLLSDGVCSSKIIQL